MSYQVTFPSKYSQTSVLVNILRFHSIVVLWFVRDSSFSNIFILGHSFKKLYILKNLGPNFSFVVSQNIKALKTFIKLFEAPQRNVKIKI